MDRIREITDALGGRLKVCVERRGDAVDIAIERPDLRGRPRIRLDAYGAEVLWGYIMAARLAPYGGLPDECTDGDCVTRLRLIADPRPAIVVIQKGVERPFAIPATFWDQLYAELCLVNAHVRHLDRRLAMAG